MKRPLKPVSQTDEERKLEKRFTRRLIALAMAGGLFGSCVNVVLMHTMGRPPTPGGTPPPPQIEEAQIAVPTVPRLRGK